MGAAPLDGFVEQDARGWITRRAGSGPERAGKIREMRSQLYATRQPGMDEYLFRPIDRRTLFDAVEQ